jgi:electron transfer flavoprotein beta subunit
MAKPPSGQVTGKNYLCGRIEWGWFGFNYKQKSKGMKIIVLSKQVPDTRHVGKGAMKEDGTVNRGALPAIFNPEDLNALEVSLKLKEVCRETAVHLLTMGPSRAAEVIREGLYRGADGGYLLSGRAFAGADTLATSYALAMALRKMGDYDLILCGRQAIDGDTAQVGPQVAEKLGLPQVTYAEEILGVSEGKVTVKRRLERGTEVVTCRLPAVVTVNGSAAECRPRNAKWVQKYKYARTETEKAEEGESKFSELYEKRPYLKIEEWSVEDVKADVSLCGLSGSPTKVKRIENVVFQTKENLKLEASDEAIEGLMKELIANHTIG